jgi:hypothetical protein
MQSAASVEEALALSENVPISLTLGYPVLGITPRSFSASARPRECQDVLSKDARSAEPHESQPIRHP